METSRAVRATIAPNITQRKRIKQRQAGVARLNLLETAHALGYDAAQPKNISPLRQPRGSFTILSPTDSA
jgi:hypothetical protein